MRKSLFILLAAALWTAACQRKTEVKDEFAIEDPTTTYSIIKSDSGSGIDVISKTGNNPLKVRESIRSYQLPETTFPARRDKFYSLLQQLKQRTAQGEGTNYEEVDSLNYLAIHYLKHLLSDPKSLKYSLRHPMLRTVTSQDKRLKIYAWDENIAPGHQSYINVFQYRRYDDSLEVAFNGDIDNANELYFHTARIESIHDVQRTDTSALYVAAFSGSQGSEHLYRGFGSIRIRNGRFDFDYPLFERQSNCLLLHYTEADIVRNSYTPKTRELHQYFASGKPERTDTVDRTYGFDGAYFTRKAS
ncbi:MAG: hypothetical protein J5873_05825 [Bacteroidales bacterium]|nr:hypothetical protein [Bacteroidales bacterium]